MKRIAVVLFVIVVGCTVGGAGKDIGDTRAEGCDQDPAAYARCVADVTAERDRCYAGCVDQAVGCAVDVAAGVVTGALPCAGPILDSLFTSCAFCAKEPQDKMLGCAGKCVYSVFDTYFRDGFAKFKADVAKCAGGTSSQVIEDLGKNFLSSLPLLLVESAACGFEFGICTSGDTTLGYPLGSCDTQFTAGIEGCDAVQCNPALCTCFDTTGCPTVGGGAMQSHMTGIVACDTISSGRASLDDGTPIACVSYTNNAAPSTCLGRYQPCSSDAQCGGDLACLDYDCDGVKHCDYPGLGGPGNCGGSGSGSGG